MTDDENSDIWEADEQEFNDSIKFREQLKECPNCKKPVTEEMDSCPYCGDILFRYLMDGTFAPGRGPVVKIVAVLIAFLVLLGVLGMVLYMVI